LRGVLLPLPVWLQASNKKVNRGVKVARFLMPDFLQYGREIIVITVHYPCLVMRRWALIAIFGLVLA
jgi:hypothetical protein